MIFLYFCHKCGREMPDSCNSMICSCGGDYKLEGYPAIHGTRDSFGIKNAFISDKGEEIDTWNKWEKAGYKDPRDTLPSGAKASINHKIDKMKIEKKQKFSVMTGGK